MQVAVTVYRRSQSLEVLTVKPLLANIVVHMLNIESSLNLCGLYFLASGFVIFLLVCFAAFFVVVFFFSFYLGCNVFEKLYHHLFFFLFQQLQQQ